MAPREPAAKGRNVFMRNTFIYSKWRNRELPGRPVVRSPRFYCTGHGFDPMSGNWDPTGHAERPKKKKKNWEPWPHLSHLHIYIPSSPPTNPYPRDLSETSRSLLLDNGMGNFPSDAGRFVRGPAAGCGWRKRRSREQVALALRMRCCEAWNSDCVTPSIALGHVLLTTFLFFCRFQHGLACFPFTITILCSDQSLSLLWTTEGQNEVRVWASKFQPSNDALVFMAISPHPESTKSGLMDLETVYQEPRTKPSIYLSHTQLQHMRIHLLHLYLRPLFPSPHQTILKQSIL